MEIISSPEESSDVEITTPVNQVANATLSPPDSQRQTMTMPTVPSGASIANSNGKRPLQTISNGADDVDELPAVSSNGNSNTNGKAKADLTCKTHASSGYTYCRPEDEPGHAWLNKKAQDESQRAWEGLQHRDCMIKNRYGDPFEAAAKEKAIIASFKQQ